MCGEVETGVVARNLDSYLLKSLEECNLFAHSSDSNNESATSARHHSSLDLTAQPVTSPQTSFNDDVKEARVVAMCHVVGNT